MELFFACYWQVKQMFLNKYFKKFTSNKKKINTNVTQKKHV